jgi:hypothetical protein
MLEMHVSRNGVHNRPWFGHVFCIHDKRPAAPMDLRLFVASSQELAFVLACACDACVTFENLSKTHPPDRASENARKRPCFTMAVIDLAETSSVLGM